MSESIRIPRLNHSNYIEWAVRMEAILVKLGYWDLVIGDEKLADGETDPKKFKAFTKRQAECKSELVLRAEDSQLAHMSSPNPKAVWDALAAVHRARGFGSRLHIRRKFITAVMKEGQGMESWIGEVRALSNRLKGIDVAVTDEDIIVVLTAGLPDSYSPVVVAFDNIDPKTLTVDFVITRLLNEEGRQDKPAVEIKKEEESDNAAMISNKSSRNIQCFYCLEMGHFSSVCPTKARDVKEREDKGRRQVTKDAHVAAAAEYESDEENYAM